MDIDAHDSAVVRRRRRVGRPAREKTPDPSSRRRTSEDDSSQVDATTASEETNAQTISMQIRPPRNISAHESKILRRRDKTFAGAAARSHSQPREAERLTSPEVNDLMRTVKRSLSSPRHKDQSSESEMTAMGRNLSPPARRNESQSQLPIVDENLSRLEQNLRRFEEERKRFDSEKKLFEREKREHKLRYKQLNDSEERKRLLQNYRKLSYRIQLPADAEDRRRMVHSLRLQRNDVPVIRRRNHASGGNEESSTQFSSSDADMEDGNARHLAKQLSPVRRHNGGKTVQHVASVRGPPPQPPERRSVSRNNSLSPIRPQRRSKTPEQRAEMIRKLNETEDSGSIHSLPVMPQREQQSLERSYETTELAANTETEGVHYRHNIRRASLPKTEQQRKRSLDKNEIITPVDRNTMKEDAAAKEIKIDDKVIQKESVAKFPLLMQKLFTLFDRSVAQKTEKLKEEKPKHIPQPEKLVDSEIPEKVLSAAFVKHAFRDARQQWLRLKADYPHELEIIRNLRNKCISHTIVLAMLCGFGGLIFRYTEGTSENIYKCEVRKVKRDFIDNLWTVSHNMREDDWKSLARQKLRKFEEELHALEDVGMRRIPGQKSWNFVNCIIFCWTVITTIGYGHITPKTTLGQSLTIIYAIIGIPMFLILLADFGKLFTRGMKFLWAYVRRLYYTGTCRKIRKQQQVRDAMSGFNTVYDMAIRRPTIFLGMAQEQEQEQAPADPDIESQVSGTKSVAPVSHPETPTSPYPETFEVDDEFNLPVSIASFLLIAYIVIGAIVYKLWEKWTYMQAFYFVFVSMSTIGFGDLVPSHPIFMMCSIIYLVFGLALTSMFINVVQIKLSDSFKQASAKIGATIGFAASEIADDAGSQTKTPSDLASVHGSRLGKIDESEKESPLSQQPASILRPPRPISPLSRSDESTAQDPPPLLPRKFLGEQPAPEVEKKKKRRFFK